MDRVELLLDTPEARLLDRGTQRSNAVFGCDEVAHRRLTCGGRLPDEDPYVGVSASVDRKRLRATTHFYPRSS